MDGIFIAMDEREKDATLFVSYVFLREKNANEIEFDGVKLKRISIS